jgi:hypothetical protein
MKEKALIWTVTLEALKTILPALSVLVATSALLQNLERSRRELASALIYNWANHLDWPTSRAIALLANLSSATIENIDNKQATHLPAELYDAVVSILTDEFSTRELPLKPDVEVKQFTINAEQSAFIRYLWIRWLNRLEGTLTAWQQGAASAEIMRAEFAPLVKGRRAELEALKHVRYGLPVIEAFCNTTANNGELRVHPKLGLFPWRR